MRHLAGHAGIVVAAGFAGWFSGSFYERHRVENLKSEPLKSYPGLPVFSSVSAATAFTPGDAQNKLAIVQNRTTEIMKYGFPSLENVRSFNDFVLSYDRRTRVANWVFEHINKDKVTYNKDVDRTLCEFFQDLSIHDYFRATNDDYKKSGFDRGHLAAAGNHKSSQAIVEETFVLSNIAPQVGVGFNRHSWNRLEKYVRKLTKKYDNVYVCTGPLYVPQLEKDGKSYVKYQVIGRSQVAVPTHFFKVVIMETKDKELHLESYMMPNEPIPDNVELSVFLVPPDRIEKLAGLLFFDRISKSKLALVNGKKNFY